MLITERKGGKREKMLAWSAIITCVICVFLFERLIPGASFVWDQDALPLAHPWVWGPVSVVYLAVVLLLERHLGASKAEKYGASWFVNLAVFHNYFLATLSLLMFVGTCYEYGVLLYTEGFRAGNCHAHGAAESGRLFWWSYIYFLSKYLELLDTVIIVLRRAQLTFLHVYHHSLVLLMSYLWLQYQLRFHFVGVIFNSFVHIFMYQFFAACLTGRQLWWKKHLTGLQIVQFISSFVLALPYLYYDLSPNLPQITLGLHCTGSQSFLFSMPLNLSFLVLFWRLYQRSYVQKKSD